MAGCLAWHHQSRSDFRSTPLTHWKGASAGRPSTRCLTWLENLARFRPHSRLPPPHPLPLPPVILRRRRQRLFLFWGVAALTEVGRWRVPLRPFVALVQVHCQAPLHTRSEQVASE